MVQLYQGRSGRHRNHGLIEFLWLKRPPSPSPEWTPPGPLNHTMKGMLMCSVRAAQELDSIPVGPSSSDYSVIL